MAAELTGFYQGTTKRFSVTTTLPDGSTPDISADVVTLTIKKERGDLDTAAILKVNADVTTSGTLGIALFSLTPAQTAVAVGSYVYDIVWYRAGGDEHSLKQGSIQVMQRVSDP